jgi:hypothetical protein
MLKMKREKELHGVARHFGDYVKLGWVSYAETTPSSRCYGLIGPGGYITCVPADSKFLESTGTYRDWYKAITIHRPHSQSIAKKVKDWICRQYHV